MEGSGIGKEIHNYLTDLTHTLVINSGSNPDLPTNFNLINMKVAIIRFTENEGRTYIVDITNDVDKWLIDNNSMRDEDEHEELSDFDIEWTTLKLF